MVPQQPTQVVPETSTSGAGEEQGKKSKRSKGKQQPERARAGEESLPPGEVPQPMKTTETPKDDVSILTNTDFYKISHIILVYFQ